MALTFEEWGNGPRLLLLLHGFTGSPRSWDHLREDFLSWGYRVLVADLRAPESFPETIEQLARWVGHVPEPIDVVGYSQGARVALGLALRQRRGVRRLVLESGSPGLRRRRERAARRVQDELLAGQIEAHGVEWFVDYWQSLPLFGPLPQAVEASLRARRLSCSISELTASLRQLGLGSQPNYWPKLPSLRVPTLLLTGERDHKFTRLAARMAAELPMAWHCTLPAHHTPHLEVPAAYVRELRAFLEIGWFDEAEAYA
ncbi:MAG: alpha/beta fold hydrolase [Myxococcota bacterium]